ncbi:MFS transporter [Mesoaciditoga lauensis]|uniref:MFS transporter n=1 Tax=Mesoaciditoga lauensis TaxID=1495039 RepID=UPI0014769CE8|nr:MFS transporter [Mesoaciditoga lauensis]
MDLHNSLSHGHRIGLLQSSPSSNSSLPNIVPNDHLTKANSLYSIGIQITQMAGPALGGFLIGFLGIPFVFALNGASFIISAFTEIFINFRQKLKEKRAQKPTKFFSDLKEGLKFLYSQKTLFWFVIIFSLMNFAGAPVDIVLTKQIKNVYHLDAMEFGYIGSLFAAGMIIGGFALSLLPELKKKHNAIAFSSIVSGLLLSILGMVSYLSLLIIAFVIGICMSITNVLGPVVEQRIIPNEKRGRVFGVLSTLTTALMPISYALIGSVSSVLSNTVIFLSLGSMIVVLAFLLYAVPKIKEI